LEYEERKAAEARKEVEAQAAEAKIMLDADILAVSPARVWRVLSRAAA
jgi:hypothetical protein